MASIGPTFQAGGLASGMDTTGLVNSLMALELRPIKLLEQRQAAYKIQISNLATLGSHLAAMKSAAASLKTAGITVIRPTSSSFTDFNVSGSASTVGRYTINVDTLASSAKTRLQPFSSASDETLIPDDVMRISLDGGAAIAIDTTGKTLDQIATAINADVTGVSAAVVHDGTNYHLSVTRKETGYTGVPASALSVTVDNAAAWNQAAWVQTAATNANVFVDGLAISRRTNDITGVIPGVTLSLKAAGKTDTSVVFERDSGSSKANLQKLIDGYNKTASYLQANLRAAPGVKPQEERLGGSQIVGLQQRMQKAISTTFNATGPYRTLGDLGVKLTKDGQLELDAAKLDAAIAADPTVVDKMFTTATTGVSAVFETLAKDYTEGSGAILNSRQTALQNNIDLMNKRKEVIEARVERRRQVLIRQFTAMEQLISQFDGVSKYLDSQNAQMNKK